jgi:hypothetical protein
MSVKLYALTCGRLAPSVRECFPWAPAQANLRTRLS